MDATLNGPFGRVNLGQTPVTIGRLPDNTIAINDSQSSSHHAVIHATGQSYSITDLGSTNGTYVNDQMLSPNVPRTLNSGDRIRVGTSQFTYEAAGAVPLDATIYPGQGQPLNAGYQSTVAAPQPYNYPDYAQQSPVPPPPQPGQYPQYGQMEQPAQPAYQGVPSYPNYPPGPPVFQQPPAPQRKGRRGLWIVIGAVIVVVLVLVIAIIAYGAFTASTPDRTFSAYCNALKNSDYQTAYNQLSSQTQSRLNEKAFAAITALTLSRVNGIQNCSLSNVQINGSAATGNDTVTFGNNTTSNSKVAFVNENGTWKLGVDPQQTQ